jgi:hypothetical protein
MARLRCRLGLHRWEYDSSLTGEAGREVELERARCRDGCARFGTWHVVESRPYDERTKPAVVDAGPDPAPDAVEPA